MLLPESANEWTMERRRSVLLHEMAHVKRRDCLVQFLGQLTCAAHWCNPAVWFAARELRRESERACDDLVLHAGTPPLRLRARPSRHGSGIDHDPGAHPGRRPLAIEGRPEVIYSYEDEFFDVVPPSNSSFFTTEG